MLKDCFGKRPGLYVGKGNTVTKVGNFASVDKAELFDRYLRYYFDLGEEPKEDA